MDMSRSIVTYLLQANVPANCTQRTSALVAARGDKRAMRPLVKTDYFEQLFSYVVSKNCGIRPTSAAFVRHISPHAAYVSVILLTRKPSQEVVPTTLATFLVFRP